MPQGEAGETGPSVLSITLYGNPILRRRSPVVTTFDEDLTALVADMFETLYSTEHGVGLSANQVGRSERVFVFDFHNDLVGHVVNPVVIPIGSELQNDEEACLSVPGIGLSTSRLKRCAVRGQDSSGEPVEYEGSGLIARCFQHEEDHLNGKVYLDRHPVKVRQRSEREMQGFGWFGMQSIDPRSSLYRGDPEPHGTIEE